MRRHGMNGNDIGRRRDTVRTVMTSAEEETQSERY